MIGNRRSRRRRLKIFHLVAIIFMSTWFLITNTPYVYYIMQYWIHVLKGKSIDTDPAVFIPQSISSIFFNMNHNLKIVLYMFYPDFRREFFLNLTRLRSFMSKTITRTSSSGRSFNESNQILETSITLQHREVSTDQLNNRCETAKNYIYHNQYSRHCASKSMRSPPQSL